MSAFGQYLLSVVAAAITVSISNSLVDKKGAIASILKLISGLVLALVIVAPWTDLQLSDIEYTLSYTEADAAALVNDGQQLAQSEISKYIITKTTAYILDKASILGLNISVDIELTEDTPPSIQKITIAGLTSPYAKKRLAQIISDDLGVTEENLVWT